MPCRCRVVCPEAIHLYGGVYHSNAWQLCNLIISAQNSGCHLPDLHLAVTFVLKLLLTASYGVLQEKQKLISVTDACACWTWINKFSRFGSTAKIYSILVAIEQTGMGDMLLQQPLPDPLSAILGQTSIKRPGLDVCQASAARQPGEDGNEAVPEQSVGRATGSLHIPRMLAVALIVCVEGLCRCQLCYGLSALVTVAKSSLCLHNFFEWRALNTCVQTTMCLQHLHAEAATQMCENSNLPCTGDSQVLSICRCQYLKFTDPSSGCCGINAAEVS